MAKGKSFTKAEARELASDKNLPQSDKFEYNIEQGSALKKEAMGLFQNPKASKQVFSMLKDYGSSNPTVQEANLKGFGEHVISRLKNDPNGPRIFVYKAKGQKPQVITMCIRDHLDETLATLRNPVKNYFK